MEEAAQNFKKMKQKYLKEQLKANKWDPDNFALHLANCREDGTIIRHQYRYLGVRGPYRPSRELQADERAASRCTNKAEAIDPSTTAISKTLFTKL